MASMDLSLDDIIKKKFSKNPVKGKGGFKKFAGNNVGNSRGNPANNGPRRPGGIQQRRLGAPNAAGNQPVRQTIGDARNRIIQKKRLQLTDARDKLCELAKRTDARQKLEKLRERRMGHEGIAAHIGYNGLHTKRPLRNAVKVVGRPGLAPTAVMLQRTISQPIGGSRYPSKVPALMDMDIDLNDDYMHEGSLQLRRTVNNDQMRVEPLLRPSKLSISSPYSWKAPQQQQQQQQQQQRLMQSSSSRGYIDLDYPAEERKRMKLPSPPPMMRPIIVSDDDDMPEPVRPTVRSSRAPSGNPTSSAKSRLESSRIPPSSASGGSSGYRIVVSNLQSTVTHEDIRELFEDVGPLVTSRLVRPGTAEVVYRQFKDAERAVENYHNRQLDGQPMKCLLVKPRPSTASSAAPSSGGLRAPMGTSSKLSGSGKSSVVPDISTIHKALFNKA